MREKLIVALDLPGAKEAGAMAASLRGVASRAKIGLTLFASEGPAVVSRLQDLGYGIFLDLKLHDIPHQVDGAVRELAALGVDMLTVHASGGIAMMRAAVEAAHEAARDEGVARPAVLAVTVLTSLGDDDLRAMGASHGASGQALLLAKLAAEAGVDGVVCSPREAASVKGVLNPSALIVTPGVRPKWAAPDDQSRVDTPAAALAAGATHLVVGRPITAALDPVEAFERIAAELMTSGVDEDESAGGGEA